MGPSNKMSVLNRYTVVTKSDGQSTTMLLTKTEAATDFVF